MKKGIVMEKKARYLVVMTHDGLFYKAKPDLDCDIGEEIQFEPIFEAKTHVVPSIFHTFFQKRIIAALAVLLLALFPVYSWYSSSKAFAYVSIDINPSIEITVNRKLNVLELTPINESAERLIPMLPDWKGQNVEHVTLHIIETSRKEGMLEGQSVLIGVSYLNNGNNDLTEKLQTFLQEKEEEMPIATIEIPDTIRKQAQEEKVSMNYVMAEKIVEDIQKKENKSENDDSDGQEELSESPADHNLEEQDMEIITHEIFNHLDDQERVIVEHFYQEIMKEIPPGLEKKLDDGEWPPGLQKKLEKEADHMTRNKGKQGGDLSEQPNEIDQSEKGSHQQSGNEKKKDDTEENIKDIMEELPPGIQEKIDEDQEEIESLIKDLPPGLQKKTLEQKDHVQSLEPFKEKKEPPGQQKKENRK
ncbi:anti-sigma factor-like protein [Melghiribacillus thermohalophilus]|uniref:Anti-sigma factor-like protein n=1 Tax=Melghiribacillus thermohalophilus TaxID=1324956 RepID=A0A4V2V0S3_9BACI|nr:anti-sigma factor domain-containing protein [Melghiribacillus thermohalophilus]TCT18007.1 anti-sigma factor-like protein [Melghiribacillus thermohalophilus]